MIVARRPRTAGSDSIASQSAADSLSCTPRDPAAVLLWTVGPTLTTVTLESADVKVQTLRRPAALQACRRCPPQTVPAGSETRAKPAVRSAHPHSTYEYSALFALDRSRDRCPCRLDGEGSPGMVDGAEGAEDESSTRVLTKPGLADATDNRDGARSLSVPYRQLAMRALCPTPSVGQSNPRCRTQIGMSRVVHSDCVARIGHL